MRTNFSSTHTAAILSIIRLEKIRQIEGTQEWIDEYGRWEDEGKMALHVVREEWKEFREGGGR